jgi:hypothetical protein
VSKHISQVLHRLAEANAPRVVLSLRPQDVIPGWITHVVYAGEDGKVDVLGPKREVFQYLKEQYESVESTLRDSKRTEGVSVDEHAELDPKLVEIREVGRHMSERGDFGLVSRVDEFTTSHSSALSRDAYAKIDESRVPIGDPLVEMEGVRIKYGTNSVLGNWQRDVEGSVQEGLWWNIHRGQRWGIFGANGRVK